MYTREGASVCDLRSVSTSKCPNTADMAAGGAPAEGSFLAVMGDEDTITGFLLAGIGNVDLRKNSNFLIVNESKHQCSSAA